MPSLKALWRPLTAAPAASAALTRSSHGLAVIQGQAFVFGGELKPRTPVQGDLTVLDLSAGSTRTLSPTSTASTSSWPASRVGATLVAHEDKLYLWGGRGGKDMGTFTAEAGIWEFDAQKEQWTELETKGDQPEPRSFHTMCALDGKLYLHAGCPASGRLTMLHALDLTTMTWARLPDAPAPGRGGTVLTALPRSTSGSPLLARFGGFAGYELDGLDVYDVVKNEWTTVVASVEGGGDGPDKRSVHALVGLGGELEWEGKRVVAVMALGEREGAPKELGHDGAGFFHDDAWALLATRSSTPSFSWLRLEPSSQTQSTPEARGWLPSALVEGNKIVFQGGLNARNERLSDGWTLEVVTE
ncbi:hypothetical protein JCM1840_001076 [Sporobolomyces johnsonii]